MRSVVFPSAPGVLARAKSAASPHLRVSFGPLHRFPRRLVMELSADRLPQSRPGTHRRPFLRNCIATKARADDGTSNQHQG